MTVCGNSMKQHTTCCSASAAANTSARIGSILDTAVLAVSVLVLPLGRQILKF